MSAMLNVGCGSRFHPAWTNLDLAPAAPEVRFHDLRRPLPFPDGCFDVVYHSHVLEHFDRPDAARFLGECWRVGKPGGILRVVVPDLEQAVRLYLNELEGCLDGRRQAEPRYDWMMLELYDQAVRTRPGGEMLAYLQSARREAAEFVRGRLGKTYDTYQAPPAAGRNLGQKFWAGLRRPGLAGNYLRRAAVRGVLGLFLGPAGWRAAGEALFLAEGETHRWMYDRFSLPRLLSQVGYGDVRVVPANESRIAGWNEFALDCDPDGSVYKPGSLYCEGQKPGAG